MNNHRFPARTLLLGLFIALPTSGNLITGVPAQAGSEAKDRNCDCKRKAESRDANGPQGQSCTCKLKQPEKRTPIESKEEKPQHRRQRGKNDPEFQKDHETFFYLLDHRKAITRNVTLLDDGVETLTESEDPEVAAKLKEHVHAMHRRLSEHRPIRGRDPLFRAIFQNADKIEMEITDTKAGVRVRETSKDPKVAKMIQSHAEVVSNFLRYGREELHRDHSVPSN